MHLDPVPSGRWPSQAALRRRGLGSTSSLAILSAGLMLTACGEEPPPPVPEALDPTELVYASAVAVDLTRMEKQPSGLYIQDLYVGSGLSVRAGSSLTVHYTGWLPDGTQFDSSLERDPFALTLGETTVIDGWSEGLIGMKEGGRRKLVIPPHLAYGPEGRPPVIPMQATLIFRIEVIDVQ